MSYDLGNANPKLQPKRMKIFILRYCDDRPLQYQTRVEDIY